jgi:hypothetical protein
MVKILSDEYPTQDTVSVSTWLIKQLQTWYLNVYIRGREMLSGKLKGMGGFSEKKQYGLGYIC